MTRNHYRILQSWQTMIKQLVTLLAAGLLSVGAYAQNPPVQPKDKPKVQKPCKPGQTAADGCHEVKKVEKKKPAPAPKKQEPKKKPANAEKK